MPTMGKCCKDAMSTPVHTCFETDTVQQCARMMREYNIGFIPVVSADHKVVGVITDRDIATRAVADGKPAGTKVRDLMTKRNLVTCAPDDQMTVAERRMAENHRSRLLVVDRDGRPQGVIGLAEISVMEAPSYVGDIVGSIKRRVTIGHA